MTKIRIGITDHSPPPFEVEREALGADAEMVFLDSRQEQDYDPEILKSFSNHLGVAGQPDGCWKMLWVGCLGAFFKINMLACPEL